jgi:hypothetical protein
MLVELGSGILEIDALTAQCQFDGKPILELPIARELAAWLQQDMRRRAQPTVLVRAHLSAKLSFTQVPWNARTKEIFYSNGEVVRSQKMHNCVFECRSEVAGDGAAFHCKRIETQEWPVGWPADHEEASVSTQYPVSPKSNT